MQSSHALVDGCVFCDLLLQCDPCCDVNSVHRLFGSNLFLLVPLPLLELVSMPTIVVTLVEPKAVQ